MTMFPDDGQTTKAVANRDATGRRGVVAANPPGAAAIGAATLQAGGNAFDAAVAAAFACCMLDPRQTGIGGYVCSAVVLCGATGSTWAMDANAIAPAAAHEEMFDVLPAEPVGDMSVNESEYSCSVRDNANVHGPLAVATPGMMAGLGSLHERWGKLPWANVVQPTIELLEAGIPYGELVTPLSRHMALLDRFPTTKQELMPQGRLPQPDDRMHRPNMQRTLKRLAHAGWRDFYEGKIGRDIADYLQSEGGIVTRQDMADFEPRFARPYTVDYRGAKVSGAVLPNGSLTVLQALNMLEAAGVICDGSMAYWHGFIEVLKQAWRDRLLHLADPDFAHVPVEQLLSKVYAEERVREIVEHPWRVDQSEPDLGAGAPRDTLHVSTADTENNVVSMTISHGGAFGSCVTVPNWGIILGHGMCRLDPRPGLTNSIAPGKRPLNNTCPTIIQMGDRDVAIGLPGGRKIVSVTTRAVQMLIDQNVTGRTLADANRFHIEAAEPGQITREFDADMRDALESLGHSFGIFGGICGSMNVAEYLRADGLARAASNVSAAGA